MTLLSALDAECSLENDTVELGDTDFGEVGVSAFGI